MNIIALACTTVLGLLLFSLGLATSVQRSRIGVLSGYPSEPDQLLARLIRAHGNTTEYAPFLALLFLYLGTQHPPGWAVWCMAGATACRVLLVVALLAWPSMSRPNPARAVGALGTYAFGTALCVAALTV
ncbi:hypothetical protein ASL20_00535 [Cupriavidus necator]|uniref:MAPEG family protein n=1 Tax=Cupriavidus TaxID=106589 RepID=UPI000330586D|nr:MULTISPECIES: MAPEG family protein [Cupriavidus]EON20663.1 hypothetical protein C265_06824 [Cupriavidus sp. GA3-3]KUE90986.1 hypothetical protein ASL20_00535 [Cupriavidus necator]